MPSNPTLLVEYQYDALNRLVSSTSSAQAAAQRFYQKNHLVTEVQAAQTWSIMQHDDRLLAQQQRQGKTAVQIALLATDRSRSVLHVLDATQAHVFSYPPYGHSPPGNGLLSPLGFNGELLDSLTGFYLLGTGHHRPFLPVLGRFVCPDSWSPFGRGGLNPYAYCAGDPVNATDPTGHVLSKLIIIASNLNKALKTKTLVSASTPDVSRGLNNFFKKMFTTTAEAFTKNPNPSLPMSEPRKYLKTVIDGIPDRAPYAEKLGAINENLASHGNRALSMEQAQAYGALAQNASAGRISNTTAHLNGSIYWAQKFSKDGQPDSLMGSLLNFGGAVSSGSVDASLHKTGEALRRSSIFLRRGSQTVR